MKVYILSCVGGVNTNYLLISSNHIMGYHIDDIRIIETFRKILNKDIHRKLQPT